MRNDASSGSWHRTHVSYPPRIGREASAAPQLQLQLFRQHPPRRQNPHLSIRQLHEQPPISQRLHRLSRLGGGISQRLANPAPAETISRAGGTIGFDQESL